MPNIFNRPASAMLISLILCLPVAILLSMLVLKPGAGAELAQHPAQPPRLTLRARLIPAPAAAFVIVSVPIRQAVHAGESLLAHRVNLAHAALIMILIVIVVGSIIADQYPCWIGVPNCS